MLPFTSLFLAGEYIGSRAATRVLPNLLPSGEFHSALVRNLSLFKFSQLAHNRLKTLGSPSTGTTLFLQLPPGHRPLGLLCTPRPAPATASVLSKQRSTWAQIPAASQPRIPPPETGGRAGIGQNAKGPLGSTTLPPLAAGRSASQSQARPYLQQLSPMPPRGRTLFTHDSP